MNTLRRLVAIGGLLISLSCPALAQTAAPPDFLQTNVAALNRVLNGKIVENFYQAPADQVARRLGDLGGIKVAVNLPIRYRVPLVTRKFRLVTFRDALYLFSQDTGLQVEWVYAGRVPQYIRVTLPAAGEPSENPESDS